MASPYGLRPGMSTYAPFLLVSLIWPQTSSSTRIKSVNSAGNLSLRPGLCTPLPCTTWQPPTSQPHGQRLTSSSTTTFWRRRPYCISCHSFGHRTLACTVRSKSNQPCHSYMAYSLPSLPDPSQSSTSSSNQPSWPQQLQPSAICHLPSATCYLSWLLMLLPKLSISAHLQQARPQRQPSWLALPQRKLILSSQPLQSVPQLLLFIFPTLLINL